jgi:coenzyme PQQ synthesis protein D (PqqD)
MLAHDTVMHPHPSLVFTRLDDNEAVLLHLDTKRYYTLNETGARIWELLQHGRCAQEIARALQDDYAITDEEAMPVLLAFVDELQQEGLVHAGGPARRG